MAWRLDNYRCSEHGDFEELTGAPQTSAPCKTCGKDSPRVPSAGIVSPKFLSFKLDVKKHQGFDR